MSTLVEALSVVIPRHVLDAGYPGGTEGYLETARRARGARYAISDERLACVSFASVADADAFTAPLSALGMAAEDGAPPPIACLDEDFGPTAACPWLRWRRHDDGFTSCWLEWTEPGELAAPSEWLPPRQRSQASRPAAARLYSPPPASADSATAASIASMGPDIGHDASAPLRIVPTSIGPLTPINSPSILAAMEGNSGSNGHALLDADSIDVDSLVATAEDAFSALDYSTAGSEVADEEEEDDWSLPEFQQGDVDLSSVNNQTTTDQSNETAEDFGSDDDNAEYAAAVELLATADETVAVEDIAAADDAPTMEAASPFDFSPDFQESSSGDDLVARHEAAFAEDVAAMEDASPFDYSRAVQKLSSSDDLASSEEGTFSDDVARVTEESPPFDYSRALHELSANDELVPNQESTLPEYAPAMDDASPFDYSSVVQDTDVEDDVVAVEQEDIAVMNGETINDVMPDPEDAAANADFLTPEADMEVDYASAPTATSEDASAVSESAIDERLINEAMIGEPMIDDGTIDSGDDDDDDTPGYMAEDDMAYDDLADMDALVTVAAEPDEPAKADTSIWTDEIDDEQAAAPNHEDHEALSWSDASNAVFDDVDALFAARGFDAPVGADVESQSVTNASADDSTAHTPASLTPVAMTAVAPTPAPAFASTPVSFSDSPLDAVRAHLAERGWRYSQDADQGALFYQTAGGRASYPGFAAADESAQLVWLYTQIPVRVPEHRRAAAVEVLTRANHGLAVGNFEFDYTDGEVRFKAVADAADGCFTAAAAGRLLRHSLDACDRYHDSLMQVIYGGLSPADAVR